jgi:hypothetical protein
MAIRRASATASVVLAAAAIVSLLSVSAWGETATRGRHRPLHGAVETCATQSGAEFPGAFSNPHNLVVGPLVLVGAGGISDWVPDSTGKAGFEKFQALVVQGHRLTVELPRKTRRNGAGLAYGPLPQGETYLRDTHRVVSFIACKTGSASSVDGRPVTFWSGSVLTRTPRCVRLLVWIDKRRAPRRAVIHLGVPTCR